MTSLLLQSHIKCNLPHLAVKPINISAIHPSLSRHVIEQRYQVSSNLEEGENLHPQPDGHQRARPELPYTQRLHVQEIPFLRLLQQEVLRTVQWIHCLLQERGRVRKRCSAADTQSKGEHEVSNKVFVYATSQCLYVFQRRFLEKSGMGHGYCIVLHKKCTPEAFKGSIALRKASQGT